ncbi:MAG TPA: hypothetical protein VHN11_18305, partial [Xanthobacteraceae bacterium]|nr:hypothetical protein [Xanthobacteraceae bacterium]
MKSGVLLNVKGVEPEAVETAREAARRAGLSLGQWLNAAIIDSAMEVGVRPPPRSPAARNGSAVQNNEGLESTHQRLDRLERLARRGAEHTEPLRDDSVSDRLSDAIARLDRRIDQLISGGNISGDLERRVAKVDDALAALTNVAELYDQERSAPISRSGTQTVPAEPDLSHLEQQLRAITQQIETLRRPGDVEDAVVGLRKDLAEIRRTLTEAVPSRIIETLQAEIQALERTSARAQSGSHATGQSSVENGLANIRSALNALEPAESLSGYDDAVTTLTRKVDLLAATGPDPHMMQQLEIAIAELRGVADRVASGDALAALASDVRVIASGLERASSAGSEKNDPRLDHLAQRIETLAASIDAKSTQQPDTPPQLELLIKSLTEKLETVRAPTDDRAFDQLENQIVQLAQKLDSTDARLGNLGAIERGIADVVLQLKDARANAIEAAEHAARSVAREMMESAGNGAEVDTFKRELTELRNTQAAIDRRTQNTLEAVHGTLQRLVDRIGKIETDLRAEAPVRASAAVNKEEGVQSFTGRLAPAKPVSAIPTRPNISQLSATAAPILNLERSQEVDNPLEPGSGAPRREIASAAQRIAASAAALGPFMQQAAPEPAGKANFIAAARRAAQAAAAIDRTEDVEPEDIEANSFIGVPFANMRRPLVIGLSIVLILAGLLFLAIESIGVRRNVIVEAPRPAPDAAGVPAESPGGKTTSSTPATEPGLSAPAAPKTLPDRQSRQWSPVDDIIYAAPSATVLGAQFTEGAKKAAAALGDFGSKLSPMLPNFSGTTASRPPEAAGAGTASDSAVSANSPGSPQDGARLPESIGGPALRNAAASGNASAEYEVAVRFAEGRGVRQNFEDAVRWFQRAAHHGLAPAQYRLGSLYEKGQGVKKDLQAARRLYVAAAEQGNGKAMHNIAVLYAEGSEGKPDYKLASHWFRKAADRAVADSQYNLGILYARGVGVEQNLAEAYKWFSLAALQGDEDAGQKRDDVAARLDPQSLNAAKLAVQTWTADPQPEHAINVKAPNGGWDHPVSPDPYAKLKPAPVAK